MSIQPSTSKLGEAKSKKQQWFKSRQTSKLQVNAKAGSKPDSLE